jgi:hypothetical protein
MNFHSRRDHQLRLRHYCRNPRCGAKLKKPVENPRTAFCCRGCFHSYFRRRCLVCEQPYQRAAEQQKLCSRRKCRRDYNKNPTAYASPWGPQTPNPSRTSLVESTPPKSAHFTGGFWCDRSDRGWCWTPLADQHHLHDREGRLAVRLVREGDDGWWIAFPPVYPELPIYPNLVSAKRAAANVVLWALPPEHATRRRLHVLARNTLLKSDRCHGLCNLPDRQHSQNERGYHETG